MTKQELQEKRAKLAKEMKDFGERFRSQGNKWKDAEERGNWQKLNKDYDDNLALLKDANEADSVEASLRGLDEFDQRRRDEGLIIPGQEDHRHRKDPVGGNDERVDNATQEMALRGWMCDQMGYQVRSKLRKQFDEAMERCGVRPWYKEIHLRMADGMAQMDLARSYRSGHPSRSEERFDATWERRAMSPTFFASGGGLVFPSLIKRLERNLLAFGGMRQVATIIQTDSGEETGMPTADDTSNEGGIIGENQSIGAEATPTVGQMKLGAHTFTSKPVLVPYSLLQDSLFDVGGLLGDMLGERLGRGSNRKFTKGVGGTEPWGIVNKAVKGRDSAGSGAISYPDLVALEHSVDPAYREGAGYMMHDSTVLAVRLLVDSQNRPLWTSGVDTNSLDHVNSRPLTINQHMDAGTTSGNKSVLFGRLSNYYIRSAGVARLYRLQERYRDNDQDGFIMLRREDGNLLNSGTAPVKYLLQS